jgi:hypothetical protein
VAGAQDRLDDATAQGSGAAPLGFAIATLQQELDELRETLDGRASA